MGEAVLLVFGSVKCSTFRFVRHYGGFSAPRHTPLDIANQYESRVRKDGSDGSPWHSVKYRLVICNDQ